MEVRVEIWGWGSQEVLNQFVMREGVTYSPGLRFLPLG